MGIGYASCNTHDDHCGIGINLGVIRDVYNRYCVMDCGGGKRLSDQVRRRK